jgi:hypothetical protein
LNLVAQNLEATIIFSGSSLKPPFFQIQNFIKMHYTTQKFQSLNLIQINQNRKKISRILIKNEQFVSLDLN